MSESLGASLPPDLLAALDQSDLSRHLGRALPLVTVDGAGRPHPMLLSYLEVLALSPQRLRIVIGAGSLSAQNLQARGAATLLVVEPERTVYVKCRARGAAPVVGALRRFDLEVEDVLADRPADWEGGLRITSGITYAPASLDTPIARQTLAALRSPTSE